MSNVEAVKKSTCTALALLLGKEIASVARYKPQDRNSLLLPVVLSEQILTGRICLRTGLFGRPRTRPRNLGRPVQER